MKITSHNAETGQITEREMNESELSILAKNNAETETRVAAEDKIALEKAALLARLGITDNEAKLLLS
jgi:hypothetical protein